MTSTTSETQHVIGRRVPDWNGSEWEVFEVCIDRSIEYVRKRLEDFRHLNHKNMHSDWRIQARTVTTTYTDWQVIE